MNDAAFIPRIEMTQLSVSEATVLHCVINYYALVRREGYCKRCFCLSVRPSVAYIANNSRTQRPSVPKFGR